MHSLFMYFCSDGSLNLILFWVDKMLFYIIWQNVGWDHIHCFFKSFIYGRIFFQQLSFIWSFFPLFNFVRLSYFLIVTDDEQRRHISRVLVILHRLVLQRWLLWIRYSKLLLTLFSVHEKLNAWASIHIMWVELTAG